MIDVIAPSTLKKNPGPRRASALLIAEYAALERRLDLIDRYNKAVGPPSTAVMQVQDDFIKGRMDENELIAFILVCRGLLDAAEKRHRSAG